MAIKKPESGLSDSDYTFLQSATSGATWDLTAHRFNLDFQETGLDRGRDNTTPDFDAAVCGDYIFRVIDDLLERYDATANLWETLTAFDAPSGIISNETAQLTVDGDELFVFVPTYTGIWQNVSSDSGASWGSWANVCSTADINKIAVVNKNRVHYTVMDTDKNIYHMRVSKYDAGWDEYDSDIWYTQEFSNFAAIELDDGSDVIVAATQVPGVTTVKLVVNVPTKYIKQAGGLIGFTYKYDTWSDHFDIDVVDELTMYRYRDRVKLTKFSDRAVLTCYSSDGTQLYPYTMYRMYTSKDGKYWSKGNALPLPEDVGSSAVKLVQKGDYVYGLEKSRMYSSFMTLQLGYSAPDMQMIVPKRRINSLSLSEGDMAQGSMQLSNEDGWLDDNGIIAKDCRTILVLRMGYFNESNPVRVQTHMFEIDTFEMTTSLPRESVKVTFRDFMAWMTDINTAERPYYWDSQLLGADNFIDESEGQYGGLRHIQPESGSFTSEGNQLNLTGNNEEGVAHSTFSLYLWNGVHQSNFKLSVVSNGEYGGLVFRSVDKDNQWVCFYNQVLDRIRLNERSGGVSTNRAQSSTLSWASTPTTVRWIQVEFRYAHIIARISTDGITWTDVIDYLMDVTVPAPTPDLLPVSNGTKERGFVGFIGRGYAAPEVDSWPDDPLPYEDPFTFPDEPYYYPPYDSGSSDYVPGDTYYPPSVPLPGEGTVSTGTGAYPKKIMFSDHFGRVFVSTNLNAINGDIDWRKVYDFGESITGTRRDPFNSKQYYFSTLTGLYRIPNIFAASPSAILVADNETIFGTGFSAVYPNNIYMSEKKRNWIGVTAGNVIGVTFDAGATWDLANPSGPFTPAVEPFDGFYDVPYGTNGIMYFLYSYYPGGGDGLRHLLNKSDDWGLTWGVAGDFAYEVQDGWTNAILISPYRRTGSNIVNKVDDDHELWIVGTDYIGTGDESPFAVSKDGGLTWDDKNVGNIFSGNDNPGLHRYVMVPRNNRDALVFNARNANRSFAAVRKHAGWLYNDDGYIVITNDVSYPSTTGSIGTLSNLTIIYYTDDGWDDASNTHKLLGAVFLGNPYLNTWPANPDFLIASITSGVTGVNTRTASITQDSTLSGGIFVTNDLGDTWFDLLAPAEDIEGALLYPIYTDVQ